MNNRIEVGTLKVHAELLDLINNEILPGTGVEPDQFWQGLEKTLADFTPKNKALLEKRVKIQGEMDAWHQAHQNQAIDMEDYISFLQDIDYLVPEGDDFCITTTNVDDEIATLAGPQLVVPVNNARFALNAVNARWGSLYDSLYGTNVIAESEGCEITSSFNKQRGSKVVAWGAEFLDQAAPLSKGSHADVAEYAIEQGSSGCLLKIRMLDGSTNELREQEKFAGYNQTGNSLEILLRNNGLHIELQIDRAHPLSEISHSGLKDIVLESALSTILDCEDSVAAVDGPDKVLVYRNWLGLMKGTLEETFIKNGQPLTRSMNKDRVYLTPQGQPLTLHGRSLLLVRNVGHLMTTDAILDAKGNEVPEGILDALVTCLCAMHDLQAGSSYSNSRKGSIYVVKPKMHGPEEVAFTNALFDQAEKVLGLAPNTIKVGVMDEERRTSANLKECIRAVKERLVFINTGFLDRTGDEIHTIMNAGAVLPKNDIKLEPWISAYEDRNVDIGLECGLKGRAQIGKGMWPKPDEMLEMIREKVAHPKSGASCAWVPSPTAATLHATHYHQISVSEQQVLLADREKAPLDTLLMPPLMTAPLSSEQIEAELDNNVQGILGYVVRWIDQGIGCSKVPDINSIGLMEDRATLRISSQLLANWLHHDVCTAEQVMAALQRMAAVVDEQNKADPEYQNMSPDFDSNIAFNAACELIFKGCDQPNGYTEPVLHAKRREKKAH